MILNIRGTSGSGKSYLVRQLMAHLGIAEIFLNEDDNPEAYLLHNNFCVLGGYGEKYRAPGCDRLGLRKADVTRLKALAKGTGDAEKCQIFLGEIMAPEDAEKLVQKALRGKEAGGSWGSTAVTDFLIRKYASLGYQVIFEGLLLSGIWGRFYRISQDFPGQFVWAYLDTPLDVCHEWVLQRNGGKPIKMEHLKGKWDICRQWAGLAEEKGERVIWLNHTRAFEHLLELLPELEKNSPLPSEASLGLIQVSGALRLF